MSRTKSNTLKHSTKAGHKRVNYIIDQSVYEAFKKKAESAMANFLAIEEFSIPLIFLLVNSYYKFTV